ncbi:autotransporter-associated beta strand repeat-containing protein [Luteolibacter yonseiensis]|uniref:Autotransporter-associated beta strand repeat-containing protein n=1 Tax=Luteolibacter yonseiensis TaxID=1144680 RepID=A0A934V7W8_9BACT|nr:autotransporter-associated beta strand repeat-containing protein [Luteolibacter yonseiensis]MBK1816607.1 autotransporter-associated beta strand repeat-containing protein [Luteolibacter yonseiensis]
MKPNRSNPLHLRILAAGFTSLIVLSGSAPAADVFKANNPLNLNQTSSWVSGSLPTAADVAVWDNTVTGAMNPGLGADASWLGIKVLNPTGLVSIGTGTSALTLGASGINMAAATENLVLAPGTLNLTTNQTWNVAAGREIRLAGISPGLANSNVDGTGVVTVQGGGTVDANQGTAAGTGLAGFSGKWIIENNTTLRGTGTGALAWGTSTAADTITLKGGTLAVGGLSGTDASYTWPQPISLADATTSRISGQNTAVGATARELILTGAITGTGNLNFGKTQTGGQVFVLNNLSNTAGVRNNVMGTGTITVTGVTLQPRAAGTNNVIIHNNNIKLVGGTLISDDAQQTFAGTITLEGVNNVQARWNDKPVTFTGALVDGTAPGSLTLLGGITKLHGVNSYTGWTTQDGGQLSVTPDTVGATSSIASLRTRSDVLLGNNVLFNITSGTLLQRMTNGFWIKASGTGAVGRLTSSSGTLNLSSVDANWVTTTGILTGADHQIQTPIVDFNGSTPLLLTKSGVNNVALTTANTHTGGTTVNAGRVQANNAASFGTGTVTVASGGQAWLNAIGGTYTNNFTITGAGPTETLTTPVAGDTNYGAIRFNNNTISGNVTVGTGGARITGVSAGGTITGTLTGSEPLEINSTDAAAANANGTVTLAGNASGYTGTVTVSRGGLTIGGAFGGSVVKNSGTTLTVNGTHAGAHTHTTGILQGTGTFSTGLTLNGATPADVLNIVPGALHVTGGLTLSGTTTVRASGLGGNIPVIHYTGALTGTSANLFLENAASFRPGTQFNTSVPGIITLDVVGVPITWTGSINRDWNTTVSNWDKSGSPDKYFQSDIVTFNDAGSGTINIIGNIAPRSITINNTGSNHYTFSGDANNLISGTTGITKTGDANLTLTSSNSFLGAVSLGSGTDSGGLSTFAARQVYSGGTTISGNGTVLDLTAGGGAGGVIRGTVNITNGGILRLTTGDATGYSGGSDSITVMNISNGGALEINNGANNQTFGNMAITMKGGNITKGEGAAAYNGSFDMFNGSASITTLASPDTSIIESGVNIGLRQPNTVITTAAGTTSTGIDLQINGSINNSPISFANPNLTKEGPGTLCLNNYAVSGIGNSTVYTGTTTINAGTLMVGDGGTNGIIGTGPIVDNGTLAFNRSDDLAPANVITGTGALVQQGTGVLTLTGGGTRSGDTVVNAGRLNIGATPFTASTFRVNAGGTLGTNVAPANSTGTIAGLSFNGGTASLRVNSTTSDKLAVTATNGFSVASPSSISLIPSGNLQLNDVIPLIDYEGAIGGASGFAGLSIVASGNPHLAFTLQNNLVDTRVEAKVTAADTLVWAGNVDGFWDEEATPNWKTSSNGSSSKFYDFDRVRFTDAAGAANTTVTLAGEIIPNTVEFDSTFDYLLEGEGIHGVATLVKNNTGKTTLNNPNTYTGPTTINAGTLELGDQGDLGATAITNNSILVYNRTDAPVFDQVISGTGQLVKRGTGSVTLDGASTFSGPVLVEEGTLIVGNGTPLGGVASGVTVANGAELNINGKTLPVGETVSFAGIGTAGGNGFSLKGGGLIQGTVNLSGDATVGDLGTGTLNFGTGGAPVNITGAHTLTKAGADKVWYRAPENGAGNTLGALVINGGTFGIEANDNGLNGVPVTVNAGGIFAAWAKADGLTPSSQNNAITLNGGAVGADFSGVTWTGPVTLTADSGLGAAGSGMNFTISGVISQTGGSFGLTKTETSTATLTAINTYTGNTTVNAGGINLADNAGLKFVIGANGVNNKITGAGTAIIDGDFTLDLTGAATANGNSWTLVDTATKTFGSTFTIQGLTESGDVHTGVIGGNVWTFTEATGVLSVATSSGGYNSWVANYPTLPVNQRGPNADYDADGLSNLLEYTLGGSPVLVDAASIAPTGTRSGSSFVVTFKRSDASEADTTQTVQYGSDLAGWTNVPIGASPGAGMVVITENAPTAELDTVTVTIPTSGNTKFFARLRVTQP